MRLTRKMIERANQDRFPKDHILRLTAQELDLAMVGHFEKMNVSTREFYAALIMAKRAWEEYTNV